MAYLQLICSIGVIANLAENSPIVYNFVIYRAKRSRNLAELCRLKTRINSVNFVRISQVIRPLGAIILVKFQIFKVLGALIPTPKPTKVKFAKFHLDRYNISPLRGRKNRKISPWVKTIPAAQKSRSQGQKVQKCDHVAVAGVRYALYRVPSLYFYSQLRDLDEN